MIDTMKREKIEPTLERNCHICANAHFNALQWLASTTCGWPAGLSCASCADSPGELRDVTCRGPCANFRAKRPPQIPRRPKESDDDAIRFIPLTRGLYATVDKADYERVNKYKWCVSSHGNKIYAVRNVKHRTVFMHRFIMKPRRGKFVDHIDGNGLNNRRANLRFCTQQQNSFNRRGKHEFTGVKPYGKTGKYEATIQKDGKTYHLGVFDTPLDAALARDRMAIKLHGRFARLNVPEAQRNREQKPEVRDHPAPHVSGHRVFRMPIAPSAKARIKPLKRRK